MVLVLSNDVRNDNVAIMFGRVVKTEFCGQLSLVFFRFNHIIVIFQSVSMA